MKRVLLIGDPDLVWMKKYIENVVFKSKDKEFILLTGKKGADIAEYCREFGIAVISPSNSYVNKIPRISGLYLRLMIKKAVKRYGHFDVAHMHYITSEKMRLIPCLKQHVNSISITFWGSDLLRKSEKQLLRYRKYFRMIQYITLGSQGLKNRFQEVYGNEFSEKIVSARFGLDSLDYIKGVSGKREQLQKKLGVSSDKKVITVGYNGSEKQNHLKVLEELAKCSKQIIQRCYLVLPMTYGAAPDYIIEVEKEIKKIGCKYKIFNEFMTNEETAEIRVITDVFIHAQPTDALSASVQEYLYASKLVINPKWINYSELKVQGAYYWEYGEFNDLHEVITKFFEQTLNESDKIRLDNNKEIIEEYSSWDVLRPMWEILYD